MVSLTTESSRNSPSAASPVVSKINPALEGQRYGDTLAKSFQRMKKTTRKDSAVSKEELEKREGAWKAEKATKRTT